MKGIQFSQLAAAVCLSLGILTAKAGVTINEVMASNGTTEADEDGDFEDWIELYNRGPDPVNLEGYGLTEDLERPFRWVFPSITIEPGEHLLVWASGKDRREVGTPYSAGWHTAWAGRAAGIWLLREGSGRVAADVSGQGLDGMLTGAGWARRDRRAGALEFLPGRHGWIEVTGPVSVTGSQTISFWIRPSGLGGRQNPWNQSYGGEGTITLEPDGTLNYYWGPTGAEAVPYQGFNSRQPLMSGRWTHVVLVRDLERRRLHWYFDGNSVALTGAAYERAGSSGMPVRLGTGYAGPFRGGLSDVLLLAEALTAEEVAGLHAAQRVPPALHTNFRIDRAGEPLRLSRPDGQVVDDLPPVPLRRDLSYGRQPDGEPGWFYFDRPTPESSNVTTGYGEVAPAPVFSRSGGFYREPFALTLGSEDPEAVILYTLDGSMPGAEALEGRTYSYKNQFPSYSAPPLGPLLEGSVRTWRYTGTILIHDRSADPDRLTGRSTTWDPSPQAYAPLEPMFKGTVVRARLIKPGAVPGEVVTHTYFVTPEGADRYQLPVLSLAVEEEHLFDYGIGVYTAGIDYDEWRLANPGVNPTLEGRANFRRTGPEWEYPVHLELLAGDRGRAFAQDLGFRISGSGSRVFPQKSLRLYARRSYSEQETMAHSFFEGLTDRVQGEPNLEFRRLILRNSGQDHDGTRFRDAFIQTLLEPLGLDRQAYAPAVHFINGEYWGLINLRERIDEHYFGNHYGIAPDDVAILWWNDSLAAGTESDREDYVALRDYVRDHSMADPVHYAHVADRMDIDNFLRYQVGQIYVANTDWPRNNNQWWRKRTADHDPEAPPGHDGRWRWLLFDLDVGYAATYASFDSLRHATGMHGPNPNTPEWATVFLRGLLGNPEFRVRFINTLADHLNTTFVPERAAELIETLHERIRPCLPEHGQRWRTVVHTSPEPLKTFARERPDWVWYHAARFFQLVEETPGPVVIEDGFEPGNGDWTDRWATPIGLWARLEEEGAFVGTGSLWLRGLGLDVPSAWHQAEGFANRRHESVRISGALRRVAGAGTVRFGPANSVVGSRVEIVPDPAWQTFSEVIRLDWQGGDGRFAISATPGLEVLLDALRIESVEVAPGTATVVLDTPDPTRGHIEINTIRIDPNTPGLPDPDQPYPWTGHYFQQVPVTVTAVARPGYRFHAWVEHPEERRATLTVWPGELERLTALFKPTQEIHPTGGAWITIEGGSPGQLYLPADFPDPHGAATDYAIATSDRGVVSWSLEGTLLRLRPQRRGEEWVRVRVADGEQEREVGSFRVLVYPAAWPLQEGPFAFTAWSPEEPEGAYPDHMLFLQSDREDPGLAAPLEHAYFLLPDDYHPDDARTVGFPYNNTRRTRINGLGDDGVSFINTGWDRDLGGALAAVDTRGVEGVEVEWLAETIRANQREYGWRLQYRVGIDGPFLDVETGDGPVEFRAGAEGEPVRIGPVRLPEAALDQAHVQLLWRYHHCQGASGPRAELRLDDLRVVGRLPGPEPRLGFEWVDASRLQLRWPAASGEAYQLESSDRLGPEAVWTRVEPDATVGYDWIHATVEPEAPARFFRLRVVDNGQRTTDDGPL